MYSLLQGTRPYTHAQMDMPPPPTRTLSLSLTPSLSFSFSFSLPLSLSLTHQPKSPCRVSHCEAHTLQNSPQGGAWSGEKLTPAKNDQTSIYTSRKSPEQELQAYTGSRMGRVHVYL